MTKLLSLLAAGALTLGVMSCEVEQTQEGELPEVDVQGGQLPAYDVDTADIDVGTTTATIGVPEVDVDMRPADITVPDVDINMPNEQPAD